MAIGEVKALNYRLYSALHFDGFYFANCVLAAVFILYDYQHFRK